MTSKDENYLSMTQTVSQTLARHESVWGTNARFKREVDTLNQLIKELLDKSQQSNIVTTGATSDKADAALALYEKVVNLGKRASIYALDNNNQELHDSLRISKGALSNMHDNNSLAKAKYILAQLSNDIAELADYGITEAEITELQERIDTFESIINRPRNMIVERKGHNDTIPQLMKGLRESIYRLDSLINIFADTAAETDYKNARVVINSSSRKRPAEE